MGKEKLDHIDKSKVDDVVTNSLKMAVTDLIISRYANESQTYVVTKDAMSVEEAADNLIDYARHMSSGKYMYAILAGIDKEFTHECVAEFIRNSPLIMEQIRSNIISAGLKHGSGDVENDPPDEVPLSDPDISEDIPELKIWNISDLEIGGEDNMNGSQDSVAPKLLLETDQLGQGLTISDDLLIEPEQMDGEDVSKSEYRNDEFLKEDDLIW